MSNCAKCGQPLKEGAKFCGQCGASVTYCPGCGELVKEGAAYCGQCGAPIREVAPDYGASVSPSAPISYPAPAQAPATSACVRLALGNIGAFFGHITMTILVDGLAARTIQMNETVDLMVPAGRHTIELVQEFHSAATLNASITRKSDLEVNVAEGTLTNVTGSYSILFGKYGLKLG